MADTPHTCSICKTSFILSTVKNRNSRKYCSDKCLRQFKIISERKYQKTEKAKQVSHAGHLKRTYGITADEYWKLFEDQKGMCKICERKDCGRKGSERLYVDHDHATGKVRGLLCQHCNQLLGASRDNTNILKNAVNYLENAFG